MSRNNFLSMFFIIDHQKNISDGFTMKWKKLSWKHEIKEFIAKSKIQKNIEEKKVYENEEVLKTWRRGVALDKNGIYESINKYHSWNFFQNVFLFRISRHSDHHAASFRPYQILRRFDEAPYHPFEYLHSFAMCMVPPLWFYLVNPRVDALRELAETGKKNNKNVYDFVTPFTEHDKQI